MSEFAPKYFLLLNEWSFYLDELSTVYLSVLTSLTKTFLVDTTPLVSISALIKRCLLSQEFHFQFCLFKKFNTAKIVRILDVLDVQKLEQNLGEAALAASFPDDDLLLKILETHPSFKFKHDFIIYFPEHTISSSSSSWKHFFKSHDIISDLTLVEDTTKSAYSLFKSSINDIKSHDQVCIAHGLYNIRRHIEYFKNEGLEDQSYLIDSIAALLQNDDR